MIRLAKVPKVASKMLQKNMFKQRQNQQLELGEKSPSKHNDPGKSVALLSQTKEINILLRLLPYFEVPLNLKNADGPDSKNLRKLLGIGKPEADMLHRQKGVTTLV